VSRLAGGAEAPRIVAPPPGPASRALSARLARAEAPGVDTLGPRDEPAVVWREALGANVLDVDGNVYLDLTAGFGVAALGHRHPRVVAAVAAQAAELVHGLGDVAAHPARVALAERLAALAPLARGAEPRVHFAVSGADAVEIALKTAVAATGRAAILAFDPAYHGTTLGALAATSRAEFRAPFAAHLHPHVVRLPYGCPPAELERALAERPFAAALVEPVVGREGVLVPPAGWLAALARAARAHGALLVCDEILTGFGRTGRRFACERDGVEPDLVCCGKALGGGLPIAAAVGGRRTMEVWRSAGEALHTGTFVAHPLACAAALAALDVLDEERLAERAARLGGRWGERLAERLDGAPGLRAVRGVGLLWGLELEDRAAARRLVDGARARGLLVLAGGPAGRVVELVPPLTIAEPLLERAVELLASALESAPAARRAAP
jgi:4-aminobutyrate aminotransferase-like enzyme